MLVKGALVDVRNQIDDIEKFSSIVQLNGANILASVFNRRDTVGYIVLQYDQSVNVKHVLFGFNFETDAQLFRVKCVLDLFRLFI